MSELWKRITSLPNLERACRRAARGKRGQQAVAAFVCDRERRLLRLRDALLDSSWRPGAPKRFQITDPKVRTISAAPFADRVLHHALVGPLEERFEAAMVEDSFACRRGKGTHRALDRAQALLRQHPWFLKLDIEQCFPSFDHEVVLATLAALIPEPEVFALCERIVRGGGSAGRGLPIGNLTSQWFANLTLTHLDRAAQVAGVAGLRYMDDSLLFGSKAELLRAELALRELAAELRLAFKDRARILAPARQGLPFLGWRLYRGARRLRRANLRRSLRRLRHRRWQRETGQLSEAAWQAASRSSWAHLEGPGTLRLRRSLLRS